MIWNTLQNTDQDVRTIVITGEGNGFCSGHDLKEHGEPSINFGDLYQAMEQHRVPILTAVNGICLAQGAGLVLASDCLALIWNCWNLGIAKAARIPMIATTTISSIKLNPELLVVINFVF